MSITAKTASGTLAITQQDFSERFFGESNYFWGNFTNSCVNLSPETLEQQLLMAFLIIIQEKHPDRIIEKYTDRIGNFGQNWRDMKNYIGFKTNFNSEYESVSDEDRYLMAEIQKKNKGQARVQFFSYRANIDDIHTAVVSKYKNKPIELVVDMSWMLN